MCIDLKGYDEESECAYSYVFLYTNNNNCNSTAPVQNGRRYNFFNDCSTGDLIIILLYIWSRVCLYTSKYMNFILQ